MGQSKQVKEFRNFTGGLVTDGPLLTRSDNTTTGELNFKIDKDGSRVKRDLLFADHSYSDAFSIVQDESTEGEVAITSFIWEAAGGVVGDDRVVVQIGNKVFLSAAGEAIPERSHITFPDMTSDYTTPLSYVAISGKLIIATGHGEPYLVTLDGGTLSVEQISIRVRDSFGEEDTGSAFSGSFSTLDDLLSEGFLDERPTAMTRSHEYNLRNQGWGTKRTSYTTGRTQYDPIRLFNLDSGVYPSNADSVVPWLKVNPDAGVNSFRIRFDSESLESNTPTNSRAPYGSFVINLLDRGQSRAVELGKNNTKQGFTTFSGSLSTDRSSGGPRLVEEFAGRVWYAGFSDEIEGGTKHSPTLSSLLAYSQSVEKISQIGKCFQEGDPTHEDKPDLVDTDGGFIKIAGMSEVVNIIAIDDALVVLARNGVWAVSGGETLFTANNQLVYKVSEDAIVRANSAVKVGNDLYFMSHLAVHKISRDQSGRLSCIRVSDKILTFLNSEQPSSYPGLCGIYDELGNTIRWVYANDLASPGEVYELVYNIDFDAFTPHTYDGAYSVGQRSVLSYIPVSNTESYEYEEAVTDGGTGVTDGGSDVTTSDTIVYRGAPTYRYLTNNLISGSGSSLQTSGYAPSGEVGIFDFDDEDYSTSHYMITPSLSLPESSRRKSSPYVVFHLGPFPDIIDEGDSRSPGSSCLVTPTWDFRGKSGKTFDAYKSVKNYNFDQKITSSRRKVRGRGRELAFIIQDTPDLPLRIYGWGIDIDTNQKL